MSDFQITISMSDDTVRALQSDGFQLYALKAVQYPGTGVPLVWYVTGNYSDNTVLRWTDDYEAFTAPEQSLAPNTTVTPGASHRITLGEMLVVDSSGGTGTVVNGTDPLGIIIENTSGTSMVCGLSQSVGGAFQPTCAFQLRGAVEDTIQPIEKVFLMFSNMNDGTGTVIVQSYAQGVLVDLEEVSAQTVTFDIDGGWTPEPYARVYPPNQNLVSLLIQPSPQPARR
jgi:hypothetical protein